MGTSRMATTSGRIHPQHLEQAIEIAVAENGRPRWVQFQRWSDANPEKQWRLQPFGGYLDDF
ncbi:hypothetical protein QPM17_22980 [Marinobacter sp. TBZ242]|uniref:Uncharacterized protein n=1 Tax=Marinobacter azerbaijanicus TaxID=3050455 RepID=A0ABT7ILL4_9GAMM|nr:hypothetical protein [Marinobacter sp. TBZ242]MDL0434009.1 hypothetical protein [Marinobacter sp. TBZ242]